MLKGLQIILIAALMPLVLSGCAIVPVPSAALFSEDTSIRQNIFVASMRGRNAEGEYNLQRAEHISYSRSAVSIPKRRNIGTITSEKNQTNASRHFINIGDSAFKSSSAFVQAVARDAAAKSSQTEVLIFVHGFNSGFDKSLFRLAQIGHDFDIPSTQILFAWPSANQLSQYIHDLDSVAYSRDGLEELIRALSNSGVKRIVLTGHSMGAALVMETLRQMHQKSGRAALRKIDGVAFFSPDMDTDVFIQTAEQIAPLPENFVIYASTHDWLLRRFSKYLTFNEDRLGRVSDFSRLSNLNMTIIDVARTETDDKSTHLALAASPVLIKAVNAMSKPGLAKFGSSAANGAIPGAEITRYNRLNAIVLPSLH